MNANIFMLFDCFLEEDQEVFGYGNGTGYGDTTGGGDGWGIGYGGGASWGIGAGRGRGYGRGSGYGWGTGAGRSDDKESPLQPTLCLVEIRSSSDER